MAYQVRLSDELASLIGTKTNAIKLIGPNGTRGYYSSDLTQDEKTNHYLTCEYFTSGPITITYQNNISGLNADEIYVNGRVALGSNGYTIQNLTPNGYCTLTYKPNGENPPSTTITGEIRYYFDDIYNSDFDDINHFGKSTAGIQNISGRNSRLFNSCSLYSG